MSWFIRRPTTPPPKISSNNTFGRVSPTGLAHYSRQLQSIDDKIAEKVKEQKEVQRNEAITNRIKYNALGAEIKALKLQKEKIQANMKSGGARGTRKTQKGGKIPFLNIFKKGSKLTARPREDSLRSNSYVSNSNENVTPVSQNTILSEVKLELLLPKLKETIQMLKTTINTLENEKGDYQKNLGQNVEYLHTKKTTEEIIEDLQKEINLRSFFVKELELRSKNISAKLQTSNPQLIHTNPQIVKKQEIEANKELQSILNELQSKYMLQAKGGRRTRKQRRRRITRKRR
jgi:hypothetical protein